MPPPHAHSVGVASGLAQDRDECKTATSARPRRRGQTWKALRSRWSVFDALLATRHSRLGMEVGAVETSVDKAKAHHLSRSLSCMTPPACTHHRSLNSPSRMLSTHPHLVHLIRLPSIYMSLGPPWSSLN